MEVIFFRPPSQALMLCAKEMSEVTRIAPEMRAQMKLYASKGRSDIPMMGQKARVRAIIYVEDVLKVLRKHWPTIKQHPDLIDILGGELP